MRLNKKIFFLFFSATLMLGSFCFWTSVRADTQSSGLTVGVTIGSGGTCGDGTVDLGESCDAGSNNGLCSSTCSSSCTIKAVTDCGGSPTDNSPTIDNIVVDPITASGATVNWTVTDDHSVTGVSFAYGRDTNYSSSSAHSGTYSVNLSGLLANTVYYYKIIASDDGGHTVERTGSFTTLIGVVSDTTPPNILHFQITSGTTAVTVSFDTSELTTAYISYGLSASYTSSTALDGVLASSHSLTVPGLWPNTTYHFQIVVEDASFNNTMTADGIFTTLFPDSPADVGDFHSIASNEAIILRWNTGNIDYFAGIKLLRKNNTTTPANGPNDSSAAVLLNNSSAQEFIDYDVLPNIPYSYTFYVFDIFNQHSSGVSLTDGISTEGPEICGNTVDDDHNGLTDCADPVCSGDDSCLSPAENCFNGIDDDGDHAVDCLDSDCAGVCSPTATENCSNSVDDDSDGAIDCADSDCAGFEACNGSFGEVCNNLFDDDSDGAIDCADSDCVGFDQCITHIGPACSDGTDNDGDGLIDFGSDPGCESISDSDESNSTIPDFARLKTTDLIFFAGNRHIALTPSGNKISALAGTGFTIVVPQNKLAASFDKISLIVDGSTYQFSLNLSDDNYYADFVLPSVGLHGAYLSVDYGGGQADSLLININSLPLGLLSGDGVAIGGAKVLLLDAQGVVFDLSTYGQDNPLITTVSGLYGWAAPSGQYQIKITKEGYFDRTVNIYSISDNAVNVNINLIKIPTDLAGQIKAVGQLAMQTINDLASNPQVEQTATQVVAPTAVGVSLVGTVMVIPWFNLVALLRFVFLQPLLLVGRGKRKQWGIVYNSLSKLPIDLALVRLVDVSSGKIVRSRVTDQNGRYAFIVAPGKYRLEVVKMNLIFPSKLLSDVKTDGRRPDIYHGEEITVSDNRVLVTANIPLDPMGESKAPKRILRERFLRRGQSAVSSLGLLVTLATLYISPVWYMWALLGVHICLIFLFRRLAKPKTSKGWGIVYDEKTHQPVGRTIARLFDTRFNRLVATEITDKKGRYNFLAGDNKYYVVYEHNNYKPKKTDVIDLTGKTDDAIAQDASLEKKNLST